MTASFVLFRPLAAARAWLSRWRRTPAATLRLDNDSLGTWTLELVSAGGFRAQTGLLRFYRVDAGTGRRRLAGRLTRPGDALSLLAGASYQVELFKNDGRFLHFFRLLDAHGSGNGVRFFMTLEAGAREARVELYDGVLGGDSRGRLLREAGPGCLTITRNHWS